MQLKDHEMLIGLLGGDQDCLPGTGSAVGSNGLEVPFRITEAVAVDGIEYEHFVATGLFVGNQAQWPMPTERPMVEVLKRLRLMSDRSASGYVSRVLGDGTVPLTTLDPRLSVTLCLRNTSSKPLPFALKLKGVVPVYKTADGDGKPKE